MRFQHTFKTTKHIDLATSPIFKPSHRAHSEDLGKLTFLFDLSLNNNNLSGNVPIKITSLKDLETLELGVNNFTALIPNQHVISPVLMRCKA